MTMSKTNIGLGILAGVAIGAAAWFISRQENKGDFVKKLGDVADEARDKTSSVAKNLREKATPVMKQVGSLVESNAELVSSLIHVDAAQVRKTGQEILQVAATLEKNLDALSNI